MSKVPAAVIEVNLDKICSEVELVSKGKVREVYRLKREPHQLLLVATDRLSAFDVIMKNGIPDKGKILTQMSSFWFRCVLDDIGIPHHLITDDLAEMPDYLHPYTILKGRTMLVKSLKMLPIEAVVRGYLTGSSWKEYSTSQTIHSEPFPSGILESSRFPSPLYTPTTKAPQGHHDEPIRPDQVKHLIGASWAEKIEKASLLIYQKTQNYASEKGILIADTKMEFGIDSEDRLVIADEILTPDSSRFWNRDTYVENRPQDSYDKQLVRNYLIRVDFDQKTPMELPSDLIELTREKYIQIFTKLTGHEPEI